MPTPPRGKQFKPSVTAENAFLKALRQVARYSGHIVEAHVDGHRIRDAKSMQDALVSYSKLISPWAVAQAQKMVAKVSRMTDRAVPLETRQKRIESHSKTLGREFRKQMADSDAKRKADSLVREQVELITSLPTDAGLRAQRLANEAVLNGTRASEIAEELMRTGEVTESRAVTIARTEVARSTAALVQTRAQAAGAESYIWRTTPDGAARKSHREVNGKVFRFDTPPTLSDGTTSNPGEQINCRCYADPVFPD